MAIGHEYNLDAAQGAGYRSEQLRSVAPVADEFLERRLVLSADVDLFGSRSLGFRCCWHLWSYYGLTVVQLAGQHHVGLAAPLAVADQHEPAPAIDVAHFQLPALGGPYPGGVQGGENGVMLPFVCPFEQAYDFNAHRLSQKTPSSRARVGFHACSRGDFPWLLSHACNLDRLTSRRASTDRTAMVSRPIGSGLGPS